jgi:pyruvate dehydrogenase E2 component (dihydrolipoamide acetyltransferase)
MAIEVIVPRLGWSSDEGIFAGWLKRDGDTVRPGDALFSLEGEKATQEIEAFDGGILRIPPDGPKVGDKVAVGKIIAYLTEPGEAFPDRRAGSVSDRSASATTQGTNHSTNSRSTSDQGTEADSSTPAASPAVRRLARELGVNVQHVTGTGKSGRITAHDVQLHQREQPAVSAGANVAATRMQRPTISPRARRVATELGIDWAGIRGSGRTGRIRERDIRAAAAPSALSAQKIPISPLRQTIAARLSHSAQTTVPVTLTATADATNLVNLRGQFKAAGTDIVPGYTEFIVKLAAVALAQHPRLNARWEGEHIALLPEIHIGIAVDTEAGLVVPVVRDVPRLSLRELAARARDLAERARQRKLTAEEMQGGTFTVTNLGAFGIDAFTPVINFPEAAILGIGRIRREPVVRDDQITVRDTVVFSLTFDHRLVDGAPAARFLQLLCRLVENPGPWLMT